MVQADILLEANEALYDACARGDLPAMGTALVAGADVNYNQSTPNRTSCLHRAVLSKKLAPVALLLERGAKIDPETLRGFTPLQSAVSGGAPPETINLLLDFGADPNHFSKTGTIVPRGENALHFAARNFKSVKRDSAQWKSIEALLRAGADPLLENGMANKTPIQCGPEKFSDLYNVLKHYMKLPRVDLDGDISKAALFETNADGFCALDNPVTWRRWPEISAKLRDNDEYLNKADIMKPGADGVPFLKILTDSRVLGEVTNELNARGESLGVKDFMRHEAMHDALRSGYVTRQIFTFNNLKIDGVKGLRESMRALTPEMRRQVPSMHELFARLQRYETLSQGRGGRE